MEDRRLLIENTNLAMLSGGLAHEIATVIRDTQEAIATERTRRADELGPGVRPRRCVPRA